MNKRELIKKYEEIYKIHSPFNETVCYAMMVHSFVEELKKLDEPQKVKVPKFVADWIKHCRGLGYSLYQSMVLVHENAEIKKWFIFVDNQDLFVRAWLDGYEIQGRKYVVTDGNHLYFKNYQEDIEIVILVDEQPGTMEYVKKFNTKEEAQKAADILGWKVQEVE